MGSSPAMLVPVCLEPGVSGKILMNVLESSALLDSGASVNLISESSAGIPIVKKERSYKIVRVKKRLLNSSMGSERPWRLESSLFFCSSEARGFPKRFWNATQNVSKV